MSNPLLLEVSGLCKCFGPVRAVNNVSFHIQRGQVVGLIGANGAGKTTVMRMLATLDLPDAGSIFINGTDAQKKTREIRPLIGWMPDYFLPYKNTSVWEYLDFFARAYALPGGRFSSTIEEVLEFTELTSLQNRLISKLSKGQTQRLCLARTLIGDPELLILDEPAAGLDPKARMEFKNLVHLMQARGKTLLISSHILSELGEMCDSLIFMDQGTIVHDGGKEDLLSRQSDAGWPYEIRLAGESTTPLENWLALRDGWTVRSVQPHVVTAALSSSDPSTIAAELRQLCLDLPVIDFHRSERRLEEAFVDILREHNSTQDSAHQSSLPASSTQPAIPASTTPSSPHQLHV